MTRNDQTPEWVIAVGTFIVTVLVGLIFSLGASALGVSLAR